MRQRGYTYPSTNPPPPTVSYNILNVRTVFCMKMKPMIPPPSLVGLLIYAEVVARLMAKTATRPWHMNSLHYDYHILSFTDVEAEKCNDHISNSEDEVIVEYNPGSCRASPHGKCLDEGQ